MRLSDIKSDAGWTLPDWPGAMGPEMAAAYLQISETRLYELIHSGAIPSYALGRVRRINRESLDAFRLEQEARQRAPAAKPARLKLAERG